jgi:hypothetical protein
MQTRKSAQVLGPTPLSQVLEYFHHSPVVLFIRSRPPVQIVSSHRHTAYTVVLLAFCCVTAEGQRPTNARPINQAASGNDAEWFRPSTPTTLWRCNSTHPAERRNTVERRNDRYSVISVRSQFLPNCLPNKNANRHPCEDSTVEGRTFAC